MWSDRKIQKQYVPRFEFVTRTGIDMGSVGKTCSVRFQDISSAFTNVSGVYIYCRQPNLTTYNDSDSCNHYSGCDFLGVTLTMDGTILYNHDDVLDVVARRRQCNVTQTNVWGQPFLPDILAPNSAHQLKHIIGTYVDFTNIYRNNQVDDDVIALLKKPNQMNIEITVTAVAAMNVSTIVHFCFVCNDLLSFSPSQLNMVELAINY